MKKRSDLWLSEMGVEGEGTGRRWSRDTNFQKRYISTRDVMDKVIIIVTTVV